MIEFDALAALPYASARPQAHAVFKQRPEDFAVFELLGYEPESAAQNEHLWLFVEKRAENTAWVAKRLAKHFRRPDRDVSFAGLKDRHAVTRQWFSVRLADESRLTDLAIPNVTVLQSLFCPKKLHRGGLAGNRFEIKLRDVSDVAAVVQRFNDIAISGFPNYFGAQRFGHHAGNLLGAERWRLGLQRPKSREEKAFFISALRGWLFNLQVARAITDNALNSTAIGFLPGKMRFDLPRELDGLVGEYGAHFDFLVNQGCSIQKRSLLCVPNNMMVTPEAESVRLAFDLPAGSYATSLLREMARLAV